MKEVNRLDISFNEKWKVKVVSDEDLPRFELRMKAFEAVLSDIAMELNDTGNTETQDKVLRRILSELGLFLAAVTRIEPPDGNEEPLKTVVLAAGRLMKDGREAEPGETLIERFKRYYSDYRKTSDVDNSFRYALDAVAASVIENAEQAANAGNLAAVQSVIREYQEIRDSVADSNDSVKERFEWEYREAKHG